MTKALCCTFKPKFGLPLAHPIRHQQDRHNNLWAHIHESSGCRNPRHYGTQDTGSLSFSGSDNFLYPRHECHFFRPETRTSLEITVAYAYSTSTKKVTIDVCQIYGADSVFLQQAAHLTGGSYIYLERRDALLQYLIASDHQILSFATYTKSRWPSSLLLQSGRFSRYQPRTE